VIILISGKEPLIVDDDSDDDDDEQEWDEISKVAVPLTISLGIIGKYKYFIKWFLNNI
jgi:hypothetical protein